MSQKPGRAGPKNAQKRLETSLQITREALRDVARERDAAENLTAHLAYVDLANRALRRTFGFHTKHRGKPWQSQLALTTRSDWRPGPLTTRRWGVIARVDFHDPPDVDWSHEHWAPTWREAIELAVAGAIDVLSAR